MKDKLAVDDSPIHGKGLFATEIIKEGSLIGVCQARSTGRPGDHSIFLQDGSHVEITCVFRYINHSDSPNLVIYDDLTVVALGDIEPGEELLHCYSEDWNG